MKEDIAYKAIDLLIASLELERMWKLIFGGEPLLNFEVVKGS